MSLKDVSKKVTVLIKSIPQKDVTAEGELLALHQATDNLWSAYRENRDIKEFEKKMANIIICACLVAKKLHIENLDSVFEERLTEIKDAFNKKHTAKS